MSRPEMLFGCVVVAVALILQGCGLTPGLAPNPDAPKAAPTPAPTAAPPAVEPVSDQKVACKVPDMSGNNGIKDACGATVKPGAECVTKCAPGSDPSVPKVTCPAGGGANALPPWTCGAAKEVPKTDGKGDAEPPAKVACDVPDMTEENGIKESCGAAVKTVKPGDECATKCAPGSVPSAPTVTCPDGGGADALPPWTCELKEDPPAASKGDAVACDVPDLSTQNGKPGEEACGAATVKPGESCKPKCADDFVADPPTVTCPAEGGADKLPPFTCEEEEEDPDETDGEGAAFMLPVGGLVGGVALITAGFVGKRRRDAGAAIQRREVCANGAGNFGHVELIERSVA